MIAATPILAARDPALPLGRDAGGAIERFILAVVPGRGRAAVIAVEQHRVAVESWRANASPDQMIQRVYEKRYALRHVEDFPTVAGLADLVAHTETIARALSAGTATPVKLIIDVTDIGTVVVKQLWKQAAMRPITVALIDGRNEAGSERQLEVARHLVDSALAAVLETGRLQIAGQLSGRLHADATAALALLVWFAERRELRVHVPFNLAR